MRFAVVGDPVSHSRSPSMHMAGYRHLGIDAVYSLLETPADAFASVEAKLRDGKLDGVNVTMPHKHNAFAAADTVDETVRRLRAVNTLVASDSVLSGFNTDAAGVLHAMARLQLPINTPVHVLGSGGAGAAAIIAAEKTRHVSISGRNERNVVDLRRQLGSETAVLPWGKSSEGTIIINATPLGMAGETLPAGILVSAAGLVDMPYGEEPTPAVRDAERLGIPYADGLVMLAGQAAEAFHLFTGHQIPVDIMETAARNS